MKAKTAGCLIGLLGLVSCADPPKVPERLNLPTLSLPIPQTTPTARPATDDQCKARGVLDLIGRSRRDIPVPVFPALQRVACTTCPVTSDYNPRRLNFFFDAETGLIKDIRCG
ncbi:MAG: hypothetical protein CGW95_02745 [Phenylobacterium zucineum]|nr:MAG: hypothetical protein CGW95_02745 [Phenylobacterium zucineum]